MAEALSVCIVTEGGESLGFGHLARCLSLCQAFAEFGVRPVLALDGDGSAIGFCREEDARLVPWHSDPGRIWPMVESADLVIVDSLLGPGSFFDRVGREAKLPVLLDDFIRRDHKRGVVVDWTVLAEERFYPQRRPGVCYLLGSRYTALRKDFWDAPVKPVAGEVENLLVTFGGSDVAEMTPRVLGLLARSYPGVQVRAVVGPGFRNGDLLARTVRPGQCLVHRPDAPRMRELMQQADLAVATGGQTLYELARMGVPTVAVMVVDNQRDDIHGWLDAGFIAYAGHAEEAGIEANLLADLENLRSYQERLTRSRRGLLHIDGDGARRLVRALMELA